MEKNPATVVTLDSDSEDDLQIVSENITNYGNYSTPVEIAPELQEKIKIYLEKRASLPGKIKTIKVYATKRNNHELSSVRASFRPSNGQPPQTINVGPSINDLFSSRVFSSRVRGGGNNNSRESRHVTASEKSQKRVQYFPEPPQKRSQQPVLDDVNRRTTGRPSTPTGRPSTTTSRPSTPTGWLSTPSSPVILYSPIRKRKTPQLRDHTDQAHSSLRVQQKFTHPPNNSDEAISTPSLIPRMKHISQTFEDENVFQGTSKIEMKTTEQVQVINFKKVTPNLSLTDLEVNTTLASLNSSVNPVNLSPMRFSSDDDEQFVEDSILVKSPFGKVNDFDSIEDVIEITEDLVLEEETSQNMPVRNAQSEDLMSEVGEELKECNNISKPHNMYEVGTKINTEKERVTNLDDESEIIIKDVDSKQVMSRYVKINVETLPKRFLESPAENDGNDEKSFANEWPENEENSPPLWTTIFPPSPPSPPPQSWMKSAALWDLDAEDFGAITGLCGLQTAKEIKRKLNAPKPLVRVLRKRHKKTE